MIFSLEMKWDESDPSDVLQSAVADTRNGLYERALAKFLWFHRHAVEHNPGLSCVRVSFALGYWWDLAENYSPALAAMVRTRDETVEALRQDPSNFDLFGDAAALNCRLGEKYRTARLFLEIVQQDVKAAEQVYRLAEDALIAERQYAACNPFLDPELRMEYARDGYQIARSYEESTSIDSSFANLARRHFIEDVAKLIALLFLNGRTDEARKSCVSALLTLNDHDFQDILNNAMNGQFPERREY